MIIICCILLVLSFGMMLGLADYVMRVKRQSLEDAIAWQSDHYDTSFYDKLEKKDYLVSAEDGYKLHAQLLVNPNPTDRYVILSHGHTDNHIGSLKYVPMYLRLGFNCIIYDIRGHGLNKRTYTTYGVYESLDLCALIDDTLKRYPDLKVLGAHGESLGASSSITALKYKPKIDFVVEDCGFACIESVFREYSHAPQFLISLGDLGMRLRYHLSYRKMRPIDALPGNKVPILFMHGGEDTLIRPHHAEEMYEVTEGPKEIHIIPGGTHAHSVLGAREEYKKYVEQFLKDIGIIHA